jgi:hypothetical protein
MVRGLMWRYLKDGSPIMVDMPPGKFVRVVAQVSAINVLLPRTPEHCNSRQARQKLSTRAPRGGILLSHNDFQGGGWALRINQQIFGPDPEPNR